MRNYGLGSLLIEIRRWRTLAFGVESVTLAWGITSDQPTSNLDSINSPQSGHGMYWYFIDRLFARASSRRALWVLSVLPQFVTSIRFQICGQKPCDSCLKIRENPAIWDYIFLAYKTKIVCMKPCFISFYLLLKQDNWFI